MKHVKLFEQFVAEVLNETLNERFKGKDLKEPALGYIYNKKGTQVQVVKMEDRAMWMSYPSLKDAIDKKFDGQIGVDLVARFKDRFDVEEVEIGGIYDVKESVVIESKEEDEAHDILQDLLNEWDPMDLEMMDMDQAMDTVDSYGHKGSKAKKIAQYLVKMAQSGQFESVKVNEASVKVDSKLAQITLDFLASTGTKFGEEIYLSRFDQDEIRKSYGGRLPSGFAGPDRSMLIGAILEPLAGDSWYMDDVDLVQGDETMMKIKPGKTTWADVKQKLKL